MEPVSIFFFWGGGDDLYVWGWGVKMLYPLGWVLFYFLFFLFFGGGGGGWREFIKFAADTVPGKFHHEIYFKLNYFFKRGNLCAMCLDNL